MAPPLKLVPKQEATALPTPLAPRNSLAPSWEGRYPALRELSPVQQARLLCTPCDGMGQRADGFACKACDSLGLRCPTCGGSGWLVDGTQRPGERPLIRCPGCGTPETLAATIQAFIATATAETHRR